MIHVGYIIQTVKGPKWNSCGDKFDEQPRICVLIDSSSKVHYFLSENTKYKEGLWITYEGEDVEVSDPIVFDDYKICYHANHVSDVDADGREIFGKSHPRPLQLCSYGYIVDKNGKTTYTDTNETYAIKRIYNGEIIATKPLPNDTLQTFETIVKQFREQVTYVCSHLQEISDSFCLKYDEHIYEKIGDDDTLVVYRLAKIAHEDAYINQFFHCGKSEVLREFRYGDYKHSFSKERAKKEKEEAKQIFLSNYNEHKHLSYLLFDYINKKQNEIEAVRIENEALIGKWNVNLRVLSLRYDGRYSGLKTFLREIELYNNRIQRK